MQLEHKFSVPAPIDTVWDALLDPEKVAPCFPGATITSVDGDDFAGTVKVKLGPVSLQYKGSGQFAEKDVANRKAVLKASGKDARGNGTASATVTITLAESGGETTAVAVTDLQVTGKPAQLGRGLMVDVGNKIIGQFATCLSDKLSSGDIAPAASGTASTATASTNGAATAPKPARAAAPVSDEIDLLGAAGMPVLKRLAPVVGGLVVLTLLFRFLKRRRNR